MTCIKKDVGAVFILNLELLSKAFYFSLAVLTSYEKTLHLLLMTILCNSLTSNFVIIIKYCALIHK